MELLLDNTDSGVASRQYHLRAFSVLCDNSQFIALLDETIYILVFNVRVIVIVFGAMIVPSSGAYNTLFLKIL